MVRSAEGLRDHLRMAAAWDAAGLSDFSYARFRRWIATTARLRVRHFTVIGDGEAARHNHRLWQEIATPREKLASFARDLVHGARRRLRAR